MKIPASRYIMDRDKAEQDGCVPTGDVAVQIAKLGPQYELSDTRVMDDGIVYYRHQKLYRAIGTVIDGLFDHSMPFKPKAPKMISRTEGLAYYQKRSAELSFDLPDTELKKIFDRYFPTKTSKTKHDPFIGFMDLSFDLAMPSEHRDGLPLEVLGLNEPHFYNAMISGVALQQAAGTIPDDVAAGLTKSFGADYAKSLQLERNRKELSEKLKSLDTLLS